MRSRRKISDREGPIEIIRTPRYGCLIGVTNPDRVAVLKPHILARGVFHYEPDRSTSKGGVEWRNGVGPAASERPRN